MGWILHPLGSRCFALRRQLIKFARLDKELDEQRARWSRAFMFPVALVMGAGSWGLVYGLARLTLP